MNSLDIVVYRDHAGKFRWHIKAGGQVVSCSDQGFTRSGSAKRNMRRTLKKITVVLTGPEPASEPAVVNVAPARAEVPPAKKAAAKRPAKKAVVKKTVAKETK